MKRPHLLGVEALSTELRGLLDTLEAAGHRVGWLDLAARGEAPPELAAKAALPLLRAVAVGPEHTVTVKRRRGGVVLTDLLREHFLGCRLVLVRGGEGLPKLAPAGADWAVETASGERLVRTAERLAADLRKPDPW